MLFHVAFPFLLMLLTLCIGTKLSIPIACNLSLAISSRWYVTLKTNHCLSLALSVWVANVQYAIYNTKIPFFKISMAFLVKKYKIMPLIACAYVPLSNVFENFIIFFRLSSLFFYLRIVIVVLIGYICYARV